MVSSVGEHDSWCRGKYPDLESVRTCVQVPVPTLVMNEARILHKTFELPLTLL